MFPRANPDPYNNRGPTNTQFTINGFSDIDRRWADRGSLYVSDVGDNYPGGTILKSTPYLYDPNPGPNSIMDGQNSYGSKICCQKEEEEDEDELTCIEQTKNFLDSLPSPDEYKQQLLDKEGPCTSSLMFLCNYYSVTIWHCTVKCVWIGGRCYNCNPGDTGKLCLCNGAWWCEEYVFPSCRAALEFIRLIDPNLSLYHPVAVVGQDTMIARSWFTRCDDNLCKRNGCLLFEDRNTPVAYTAGVKGDGSCGEGVDEDGNSKRQPASDDNAWTNVNC